MIKAAIVGATGYAGYNLMKQLVDFIDVELCIVTSVSKIGKKVNDVFPDLDYDLKFSDVNVDDFNRMDLVFLAVPHGKAKSIVSQLKCKVIDLSADHRLTETYGLPEVFGKEIEKAKIVANPGCYATACILAVYPIKDMIKSVVFDGISGYSGGGKNAEYNYRDNIIAYKLTDHHQTAELDKILGLHFSFTPHVVNAFSGIMCTAHITLNTDDKNDIDEIRKAYKNFYKNSKTKIINDVPCTKDVVGTPSCIIGGFKQDKYGNLVIVAVIDNLLKGAASQAIENMKIMFGLK